MPKRRRVDLSLRLEEAKDAAFALDSLLRTDDLFDTRRLRRVLEKLQQGIEYVTEVNPSHRPPGAKARTP